MCPERLFKKEISFLMRQRIDICRHSNCVGLYQMSPTSVRIHEDYYIKKTIFLREGSQKFHKFMEHLQRDQDVGGLFLTINTS